jgi:hypothetical protein
MKISTAFSPLAIFVAWLIVFQILPFDSEGQVREEAPILVCPGSGQDMHTMVAARVDFLANEANPSTVRRSTFIVTYSGFPPQARQAFQYAVDIWESILSSPVPIRINANWAALEASALGSAGATSLYRDFQNAPLSETWYPVALAERLAAKDLNATTEADIVATFNSNINWYFGTDGNTPAGQYNLVTVVLHEITHGLGYFSSFDIENNIGIWGEEQYPFVYDAYIENRTSQRLLNTSLFANRSVALANQLTSNNLFFESPLPNSSSRNGLPRLYAPPDFNRGSSISHLDEFTYRAGNPNSLMTPQIGRAESIFWPGEITITMLTALGWRIRNPGTTEEPFTVFPNPTEGILTVDALFAQEVDNLFVSLTDLAGKQLLSNTYSGSRRYFTQRLDLNHLPAGVYLLYVKTDKEEFTKRILVSR